MEQTRIYDLDGTLVNVEGFTHLLYGPSRNLDEYHEAAQQADAYRRILDMLVLDTLEGVRPIIVTARPSETNGDSYRWLWRVLGEHGFDAEHFRGEVTIINSGRMPGITTAQRKVNAVKSLSEDYEIVGAIDDCPEVVAAYKQHFDFEVMIAPGFWSWPSRNRGSVAF